MDLKFILRALLALAALVGYLLLTQGVEVPNVAKAEAATIALVVAAIALVTTAAIILSQKPPEATTRDDRPETLATRGAYVPLILYRERTGPIVGWIQPESPTDGGGSPESGGGSVGWGKGGGGSSGGAQEFFEQALHYVCVGPASRLHAIFQNGKKIWQGPISPLSHPSGTSIDIPGEGSFQIYWGSLSDPAVNLLASASNSGITSRFPLTLKILWNRKNLGLTRQWPRLEYEVECPIYSPLSNSPAIVPEAFDDSGYIWQTWMDRFTDNGTPLIQPLAGQTANDEVKLDVLSVTGGPEYSRTREIFVGDFPPANGVRTNEDFSNYIGVGDVMKLYGGQTPVFGGSGISTLTDRPTTNSGEYYHILDVSFDTDWWSESATQTWTKLPAGQTVPNQTAVVRGSTKITVGPRSNLEILNATTESPTQTPKAEFLRPNGQSGANPVHMVCSLLFAPFPYGARRNLAMYDSRSMEDAAIAVMAEGLYGSYRAIDGETAQSAIAKMLQDLGMFISWEPKLGKYVFRLIRNAGLYGQSSLPEFLSKHAIDTPTLESNQGPRPVDRQTFTFRDRSINYREQPITIDEDGQAIAAEYQSAKNAPVNIANDYRPAEIVARRRGQEGMANQTPVNLLLNHDARWVFPGLQFFAGEIIDDNSVLVAISIRRQPHTGRVEIECMVDAYGLPAFPSFGGNDFTLPENTGGRPQEAAPPSPMQTVGVFEIPRYISNGTIRLFPPRLRLNKNQRSVRVWLSADGITYDLVLKDDFIQAGGFLTEALPADGEQMQSQGPVIEALNDDMLGVEDLSSSPASFFSGRQIAIIGTSEGSELCFLERVTALGDNQWQLNGLLRGRLGQAPITHGEGAPVFIALAHQIEALTSPLLVPGRTVYIKVQPFGAGGGVPLQDISPITHVISGTAYRPLAVSGLRLDGFRRSYSDSENLTFKWCYRSTTSPRTGAGMQGFGEQSGRSLVEGEFVITILDSMSQVLNSYIEQSPEFLYTADMRLSDGIDDSANDVWTIRVENVLSGYVSQSDSLSLSSS